jgi:hypothetical protein
MKIVLEDEVKKTVKIRETPLSSKTKKNSPPKNPKAIQVELEEGSDSEEEIPAPSKAPTKSPTKAPTKATTKAPTKAQTKAPTKAPIKVELEEGSSSDEEK